MIAVEEATKIILDHKIDIPDTFVSLDHAIDRILREELTADRDLPPYDRVTMDGIAIAYDAFAAGRRKFPVEGIGAAGAPQQTLQNEKACIEIMTGAMLPDNADTIIRYEDVVIANGVAAVQTDQVQKGQNIHRRGTDRHKGTLVVPSGRLLSSAEIGVAATVGKEQLRVAQLPAVVIVSTGDELVPVHQTPLPYQIRKSNVHRLQATLRRWGFHADTAHLVDDEKKVREEVGRLLEQYPVVVMSGGVSKGRFDYVPEALKALGVKKLFHRIRQRPGKPFWFGSSANGTLVFAFPGNPVSSFMCTIRYMQPWVKASLGLPLHQPHARLAGDIAFTPDLTYFAQVALEYASDGCIKAHPVEGHGSGDLANLVDADAFIELPRGKDLYRKGEVHPVWPYR